MSASSVTGVGPGSADKVNKGSQHMHLGVTHLIGPRVVDAGTATMNGASPSTVNVPFTQALPSAVGYSAFVEAQGTSSGAPALAVTPVSTTGFAVYGPNGNAAVVNWLLVYSPDAAVVGSGGTDPNGGGTPG